MAVIFLAMGMMACTMPVAASVYTISPGDSIQQAINGAAGGDEIVLNPGTYSENGITVTGRSLVLRAADGHNASDTIIDGKSTAPRILTVTDASALTIDNLTLRNGRAANGAESERANVWGNGDDGGNGGSGGAIASAGTVTLISASVSGCSAGNGGNGNNGGWDNPFYGNGGNGGHAGNGGAIYATGAVTLISSTIDGCSAGNGGTPGLGLCWINTCHHGKPGRAGNGGAIYTTGTVSLISSTIARSRTGPPGMPAKGGIRGAVGGDGGAIYTTANVLLNGSAISECRAGDGGMYNKGWGAGGHGGNGGAIFSGGTVTLAFSTLANCNAGHGRPGESSTPSWMSGGEHGGSGGNGGAIHAAGAVMLASSTIANCRAGSGGAGSDSGEWLASGGSGGSGGDGGAVWAGGQVGISNTSLTSCSAGRGAPGGNGGPSARDGSPGTEGNGGAVYSYYNSISVKDSTFTDCTAGGDGGALYSLFGRIHGQASAFTNCVAGSNGGAVHTLYGFAMRESTFTRCGARAGGAVYGGTGKINYCRLVNNNGAGTAVHSLIFSDAKNNWWGSNGNPSGQVSRFVSSSPWLVLGITATPASITTAETSTVSANLTFDSAGAWHDPAYGHVPDAIPVSFTVVSGPGSVSPGPAGTVSGISQTLFTPSSGGTAMVIAGIDGQQVPAIISISGRAVPPAVTGISPVSGPASGGTPVTITGTGFTGATGVRFGSIPARFTVTGTTAITATSPPGTPGTADITVTAPGGTSEIVPAGRFTYSPGPTTGPTTRPTTKPTKEPTREPTTRPTTVPTPGPVPDIAGCWYLSHSVEGTVVAYTYAFEAGGAGWMNSTRITAGDTDTVAERVRWEYDQQSAVVTVTKTGPGNDPEPDRWVLTYVKKTDVLDGGEKGGLALVFRRVPCNPVG